jgi:hypothetical protein
MIYRAKMPESFARLEWCKKTFGHTDNDTGYVPGRLWWRDRGYLCFRNEQDYLLYLLRWC